MKAQIAQIAVWVATVFAIGYFGYVIGHYQGVQETWEANRKLDCEMDYQFKPVGEVPVRCLKYFDLPKQ